MHINFIIMSLQVTTRDKGRLWKVNEFVATIFLGCEKTFRSFTSQFQPVLRCSDLVQKMKTNSYSIVVSNFNSLFYYIEPRVNKEIIFNLLENTLTLFTTVHSFCYAKDIKKKHKIKSYKSKSLSLRREIKESSSSKDMGY